MNVYDCFDNMYGGTVMAVPEGHYHRLAGWASDHTVYRTYAFGNFLRQQISLNDSLISVNTLTIEIGSEIGIIYSPAHTYQYVLEGNCCKEIQHLPGYKRCGRISYPRGMNRFLCHPAVIEWFQIEQAVSQQPTENVCSEFLIDYDAMQYLEKIRSCSPKSPLFKPDMETYVMNLQNNYAHCCLEAAQKQRHFTYIHQEVLETIHASVRQEPFIHHSFDYFMKKYRISKNCLKNGFVNAFGITLADHIETHCMKKANHLLKTTTYTLDEISDLLGYAGRSALSRAYKRYFGYAPHLHRIKTKGQNDTLKDQNDNHAL